MDDEITTDRLVLRQLRSGDAVRVSSLVNNLSVSRWLTRVPYPYSVNDAQDFIENVGKQEPGVFTVTHEGEVIGGCSGNGELGYWFGEQNWGQGFATEAGQAVVDWYFARTTSPLISGYILGNTVSSRVLEKLGFKPSEQKQEPCLSQKQTLTVQKMRLSVDDWRAGS